MLRRLISILLGLLLSIVVIAVIAFALLRAPDRSVAELSQWQLPDSEFIDIAGTQAHVVQSGLCQQLNSKNTIKNKGQVDIEPPVVVLLHGTSASLHTWQGWAEQLDKDYCVIRMDLPGFGLTGPFADKAKSYHSDHYADFVMQVLDKLHFTRASFVGNSLGGKVAWLSAVNYPERVDKLILIDAAGYPATPKHVPIGFKLAKYPKLDPLIKRVLPRSVVKKSLLSVYADDTKVTDELVNRYYELTLRAGNRGALGQRMREFDSLGQQARIKDIAAPTLILWGGQDDLIPPENGELFHQAIKGSQLVMFPDLGHVPQEEDAVATAIVAKAFLDGESISIGASGSK
jgi:pimeloyl-ACP methyl ester carboxylesterase